jgi:hypothetical protein
MAIRSICTSAYHESYPQIEGYTRETILQHQMYSICLVYVIVKLACHPAWYVNKSQ